VPVPIVKTLVACFVCLVPVGAAVAASPSAVLAHEFVFRKAEFSQCHASTIAETTDGSLVVAWFGGTREGRKDVSIWVSRRVGNRWTEPVRVADGVQPTGSRFPCWNPVLFQPKTGPLMLFFKVGPSPRAWWGEWMISADAGKTWKRRQRLPGQGIGPVKNKPVQLADGTIWCGSSTEHDGWQVHLEMTRDLGKTWTRSGPFCDGKKVGAIQPSLLLYDRGRRWQMLCRNRNGQGDLWQTWSGDGGRTWSRFESTGLPNPNAGTDAVTLREGTQVLVYNHTNRRGEFPSGRNMLNLSTSRNGRDWTAALVLERDKSEYSYPAVIQGRDGRIHIVYTWRRLRVRHVVVDGSRLTGHPIRDRKWPDGVGRLPAGR
jgi:predicted neuraminidase